RGAARAAKRVEHLRSDVDVFAEVQRVRDDEIVALLARVLLHVLEQRPLELADLLVAANVRVLEKLVLRALQIALAVADLPLETQALFLAHHRRVAAKRLLLLLQCPLLRDELALPRR